MAVVDVGFAAHAVYGDAAKTVFHKELRVGGSSDVVIDRIGGVLADVEPFLLFAGIDGADAHAVAGLLHFDLYLLRVGFGFLARPSLHPNGSRDFTSWIDSPWIRT